MFKNEGTGEQRQFWGTGNIRNVLRPIATNVQGDKYPSGRTSFLFPKSNFKVQSCKSNKIDVRKRSPFDISLRISICFHKTVESQIACVKYTYIN